MTARARRAVGRLRRVSGPRAPTVATLLVVAAIFAAPAVAQREAAGPDAAQAIASSDDGPRRLVVGRVELIVPTADAAPWARGFAERADAALVAAAAFFEVPPPRVTVVLRGDDDLFNAWVDPLGGPVVSMPAHRAWPGDPGASSPDPVGLLLVHEMIHAVHFGGRPGSVPVPLGLVGADTPWPPPAWLLEGVAVWAESRLLEGGGGRIDDPDARSVLRVLAAEGSWPSLSDAALIRHDAWPGGRLRYLAGGALVERLIARAGRPAFLEALRRFETQAPWLGFDHAWREVVGGDLEAEWAALRDELADEARALSDDVGPTLSEGRSPARSGDGTRLAWLDGVTVRLADWPADGTLSEARAVRLRSAPDDLAWWGTDRLVYSRLRNGADGRLRELYALDLDDGRETRLTAGARGRAPAPLAGGCLAFVRDDGPGGSQLRRWCPGGVGAGWGEGRGDGRSASAGGGTGPDTGAAPGRDEAVWRPPGDGRIVGLASSPEGRLALVLDERGRRSLHLLDLPARGSQRARPNVRAAPAPPGSLRDPVWEGEGRLWIVADAGEARTGSWRIDLASGRAELRAAPRGGVVGHAPGVVAARRAGGPELVRAVGVDDATAAVGHAGPVRGSHGDRDGASTERPNAARTRIVPRDVEAAPEPTRPTAAPHLRTYDPRSGLRLLGWLPDASPGGGFGVRLPAVDALRDYGATLSAGVEPSASGPLGRFRVGVTLRVGDAGLVPTPAPSAPRTAELRVGVLPVRPHRSGSLGLRPRLDLATETTVSWAPRVRLRADASLQAIDGRPRLAGALRATASEGRGDAWAAPLHGWAAAATMRSDPLPAGRSNGAWLDGVLWRTPGFAGAPSVGLGARGGWRPPAPAPGAVWTDATEGTSLSGSLTVRWRLPVQARVADGRWALERLRLGPTARVGGALDRDRVHAAYGLEGEAIADLVLGYGALASTGVRAGIAWDGRRPLEGWVRWTLPGLP